MDNQRDHTRKSLIQEIKRVAKTLDKETVSRTEFIQGSGISEWHVLKHFDCWNDFVRAAGLQPTDVSRIPDNDLFEAMYRTFLSEQGITTRTRFRKACQYSDYVYTKRWGRWDNVLFEFKKWINQEHPDFPYMGNLPSDLPKFESPKRQQPTSESRTAVSSWSRIGNRLYGSMLNFRGLQHAPMNEQGVVFLFGMVARELGFVVESVRAGFPDCVAKRCVRRVKTKDIWEQVRIEFEYESRSFRDHGHNPNECDLIVCWEDNWQECPIEVLELRSVIETLEK